MPSKYVPCDCDDSECAGTRQFFAMNRISEYLELQGSGTTAELARFLCLHRSTVRKCLAELIELRLVEKTIVGGKPVYRSMR